ncbi:hypothetical protein [Cellulomonas xiejunii]|nr:hypothetical protein [Cellulomonas xiejunii]MCC2322144.1 hypothetical protein [Cellulomonas xiejunii]MCC2323213.1 hypothetical protein [Cellulomonas xiejunii]
MGYAMALVPGERRALSPDEMAVARDWVSRLQARAAGGGRIPAGVVLAWPSVVAEVRVEHAAADGATLCGIDASRYEVYRALFEWSSPRACPTCARADAGALWSERPQSYRPLSSALSEREALAWVGKAPGMFVGRAGLALIVAWLGGYDFHGSRTGAGPLEGFKDWLLTRPGAVDGSQGWPGVLMHIVFPGQSVSWSQLTPEQDRHAVTVLFELLDAFLADKELNAGRDPSSGTDTTE